MNFKNLYVTWSHQVIPPAIVRPDIDTFLNSSYHSKNYLKRNQSSIFTRSAILMKWYRDETRENMQKHEFLSFLHESWVSKTFQKKKFFGTTSWPPGLHMTWHQKILSKINPLNNFCEEKKAPARNLK